VWACVSGDYHVTTVDRAEDLPCTDSYVVVVLGNSSRFTQMVHRTANPVFDKTFEM